MNVIRSMCYARIVIRSLFLNYHMNDTFSECQAEHDEKMRKYVEYAYQYLNYEVNFIRVALSGIDCVDVYLDKVIGMNEKMC